MSAEPDALAPAALVPASMAPAQTALQTGVGATTDAAPAITLGAGQGLAITSPDGLFSVGLRSRFVPRVDVLWPSDGRADARVSITTARIWIQGHAFGPDLSYVMQLAVAGRDYRDNATSPLFDAYIDWQVHRNLHLKVGQYFVPFDRMRTVREFALQMTDRPRPVVELSLDRDVGVALYSEHLGGDQSPVAFRLGVFGGGGTNLSLYKPAGALMVGRLELRPLGDIDDDSEGDLENRDVAGLALGVAVAYNLNTNRLRSTSGETLASGTIDYVHAAADLTYKWRGFALQGEYLYRDASQDLISTEGSDGVGLESWARSGHGWVVQSSYHVRRGIEVVGRGSRLYALPNTDPAYMDEVDQKGQEAACGINWYLNGHRFKVQTTWITLWGSDLSINSHAFSTQLDAMF